MRSPPAGALRWFPIVAAYLGLAACAESPREALQKLGSSIQSDDILYVEAVVDLDSVAASLAAASEAAAAPQIRQMISLGLDQGLIAPAMMAAFLEAAGVNYDSEAIRRAGDRFFRGLDSIEVHEGRALATIRIAHPFDEESSVPVRVELRRNEGEWRVVGLRGLGVLAGALTARSPREAVTSDLRSLASSQEIHYSDAYRYSSAASEVGFNPTTGVSVEIDTGPDGQWWSAEAEWSPDPRYSCALYFGWIEDRDRLPQTRSGATPAQPGEIMCDQHRRNPYDYFR